jgi:isocitrate dehydrogenase
MAFADKLEAATVATIESGIMTGDLASLWEGEEKARTVTSREFLNAIAERM